MSRAYHRCESEGEGEGVLRQVQVHARHAVWHSVMAHVSPCVSKAANTHSQWHTRRRRALPHSTPSAALPRTHARRPATRASDISRKSLAISLKNHGGHSAARPRRLIGRRAPPSPRPDWPPRAARLPFQAGRAAGGGREGGRRQPTLVVLYCVLLCLAKLTRFHVEALPRRRLPHPSPPPAGTRAATRGSPPAGS